MAACAREGGWEQQQKGQGDEGDLDFVAQEEEVWEQEGGKPREDNGTIAEEQQRLVEQQLAEFIRHMDPNAAKDFPCKEATKDVQGAEVAGQRKGRKQATSAGGEEVIIDVPVDKKTAEKLQLALRLAADVHERAEKELEELQILAREYAQKAGASPQDLGFDKELLKPPCEAPETAETYETPAVSEVLEAPRALAAAVTPAPARGLVTSVVMLPVTVVEAAANAAASAVEGTFEVTMDVAEAAANVTAAAVDAAESTLEAAVRAVKEGVREVADVAKSLVGGATEKVEVAAAKVKETAVEAPKRAVQTVKGGAEYVAGTVKEGAERVTETAKGTAAVAEKKAEEVVETGKGLVGKAEEMVEETVKEVTHVTRRAVETVEETAVRPAVEAVSETATKAYETAKGAAESVTETVTEPGKEAAGLAEEAARTVKEVGENLYEDTKEATEITMEAVKHTVEEIMEQESKVQAAVMGQLEGGGAEGEQGTKGPEVPAGKGPEAEESGKGATKGASDVELEEAGRESSEGGATLPRTRKVRFSERVEEAVANLNQIEEEVEIAKEKLSTVVE
ncbi:hypothetical protein KFL_000170410 [Klebsormidium nitens]|uniref:Uncharacterized protein n=1 Tax=Klebsormidium nitens TaxID=105231 RepID=A0A1Y1HJI1_KLENI|nr:hypothetical protein KFL_000170410 [Klebsormidium nitens]|eukprot:GAQ78695.1 hypothetical protein KFL_000170410 [Klebsormidium nitens]